jgi:osmotically inducible lipoprotein OsmB
MEALMFFTNRKIIASVTIAVLLTACGETPGQRALSGGAIGAGAGAVGAAILSADPVTGAVVGAAAGAVTGAVTKKKDINLGDIK